MASDSDRQVQRFVAAAIILPYLVVARRDLPPTQDAKMRTACDALEYADALVSCAFGEEVNCVCGT